jgi:hypothetical protein
MNDSQISIARVPDAAELRASYTHRFPGWTQSTITRLTGKAGAEEPPPRWLAGPRTKSAQVISQFFTATGVSLELLITHPMVGFVALPALWLFQVNALHNFQDVIAHHALHNELLKTTKSNYRLQVLISTLLLTQNFEQYFAEHIRGHHSRHTFTTERDPDSIFLVRLGFRPGQPLAKLQRRMRFAVLSPRFHALYLAARIKTNFITAAWHRKILAATYISSLAALAVVFPWWVFALAVVVPLVPLYHIAALLQLLSEHPWTITPEHVTSSQSYAERCWGRFFLEPLPPVGLNRIQRTVRWTVWAARVALIQLPSRFAVVVGDMPGHDLHHLHPNHDWTKTLWARQERIDTNTDPHGMKNREFANLAQALTFVLDNIANTPQTPQAAKSPSAPATYTIKTKVPLDSN